MTILDKDKGTAPSAAELKRLPPYRRRQLRRSLGSISRRLDRIAKALSGTPDGERSGTPWENCAGDLILDARITLDMVEDLLVDDKEEGGA